MINSTEKRVKATLKELRYTLGGKLMLAFTLLILSVVAIATLGFPSKMKEEARKTVQQNMLSISTLTASNVSSALFFDDSEYIKEMLRIVMTQENAEYILVLDTYDGLIAGYNQASAYFEEFKKSGLSIQVSQDNETMSLRTPISIDDQLLGNLFVGYSLEDLNTRLRQSLIAIYSIGFLVLVIGVTIVFLISRKVMAPLHNMMTVVEKIKGGATDLRINVESRDEIGSLAMVLNTMLDSLEKNTTKLKKEVATRKETEQGLKASLKEKDVLLKEIHHRVKNNLQIISSLLYLQSAHTKSQETVDLLTESQTRVKSMALIHEKLYRGEDLANIKIVEYLRNLTTDLKMTYRTDIERLETNINGEDVLLDIEAAIPCGLIVNELFTNTLKYAFPPTGDAAWNGRERPMPQVDILFERKVEDYILTVRDNGVGLQPDTDLDEVDTLGLKMVGILTTQIDGTAYLNCKDGTEFKISFPIMR